MDEENDWRIQYVGELREDWDNPWTGTLHPKGSKIIPVSCVELHGKKEVSIPIPNASASCLNVSKKCWDNARKIRKDSKIDSSIKKHLSFNTDTDALDYIEYMMQSVIFAFTALEGFVNEMVPEDYIYEKKGRRASTETFNKIAIERWLTIDEKFGSVLPKALKIDSPKGSHKSWNELIKLKTLRDRLIHMKNGDRRTSSSGDETIWSDLVRAEPPYREAFSIIKYFVDKLDNEPRWFKNSQKVFIR